METWKDIQGYEGLYQVSDLGRVRSLNRKVKRGDKVMILQGVVLKPQKCSNGYCFVTLSKGGDTRQFLIHRLVAKAFMPNGIGEVNHIDENKNNNILSNLEWLSHKANINYGSCIERRTKNSDFSGSKNPMFGRSRSGSPRAKRVAQLDMSGNIVAEYACIIDAAEAINCSVSSIRNALKGRTSHCRNFKWIFLNKLLQ